MSHFSVMVIGDDVEKQMAPYHEFECTGTDDEYVVDKDTTEETTRDYLEDTRTMMRHRETSELKKAYDNMFYREPTAEEEKGSIGGLCGTGCGNGISWSSRDWDDGKGYRAKVHHVPEEWEEIEIPFKELMSFTDYVVEYHEMPLLHPGEERGEEHKFNYAATDENGVVVKTVTRTNPNAKWDYWQEGGRASGRFIDRMDNAITRGPRKAYNFETVRNRAEIEARLARARARLHIQLLLPCG